MSYNYNTQDLNLIRKYINMIIDAAFLTHTHTHVRTHARTHAGARAHTHTHTRVNRGNAMGMGAEDRH